MLNVNVTSVPRLANASNRAPNRAPIPASLFPQPLCFPSLFISPTSSFSHHIFTASQHVPFGPSAASEYYIYRSSCTQLLLRPCLERVIEVRVHQDGIRVNEDSKLKSEVYECEGYMYRGKGSAKPDRALASLKGHVSQEKAEHARNNIEILSYLILR